MLITAHAQTNNFPLYSSGDYSGGSGDLTNITNPHLKLVSPNSYPRVVFVSNSNYVAGVFNFQSGKHAYWGEPGDAGNYYFRGRDVIVEQGRLEVAGRGKFSNNVKIFSSPESWGEGVTVVGASGWSGFRLTRNDPATNNYAGNWALGYTGTTGNDFSITTHYNGVQYDGVFHISNSTRNVGIGTTAPGVWFAPDRVLEMSGARPVFKLTSTDVLGTIVFTNVAANGSSHHGEFHLNHLYNPATPSQSYLDFGAYPAGSTLTLRADGNVGIGTITPDAKLSVKGQIHAQEVKVDLNGAIAPDYVFDKDYNLPSLEEIQSYITAYKHLPEVPSAKEMEEKGINLGEMNLLLLKKVEELTLYQIQSNEAMLKMAEELQTLRRVIQQSHSSK
jgi:hypothetical protein